MTKREGCVLLEFDEMKGTPTMALTKSAEFKTWKKGDPIRVLNEEGVFLFQAHVMNSAGEEWVDCFGPCRKEQGRWKNIGQARSFNVDRILAIDAKTTIKGRERKMPKSKEPQVCLCGCGEQTKGGRFIPGHDARLKGQIVKQWREAKTPADKAKAQKALVAINPEWEKYLVELKVREPKATKAAKATKTAKAAKAGKATKTRKAAKTTKAVA